MNMLILIALKSLLLAGATLSLLALMKRRSAAQRSWVAHVGLLALVLLAVAPAALPRLELEAPVLLGETMSAELPLARQYDRDRDAASRFDE